MPETRRNHRQLTGSLPGHSLRRLLLPGIPAGAGAQQAHPAFVALPADTWALAWVLGPLSVMVIAVGWSAAEARPEPAYSTGWESDLTGVQPHGYVRRETQSKPMAEPVTVPWARREP